MLPIDVYTGITGPDTLVTLIVMAKVLGRASEYFQPRYPPFDASSVRIGVE
jgi:hypothetical protein